MTLKDMLKNSIKPVVLSLGIYALAQVSGFITGQHEASSKHPIERIVHLDELYQQNFVLKTINAGYRVGFERVHFDWIKQERIKFEQKLQEQEDNRYIPFIA